MPKNLKKFRKKGPTFDEEYAIKQEKLKKKKKKPIVREIDYNKNFDPKKLLEEEE